MFKRRYSLYFLFFMSFFLFYSNVNAKIYYDNIIEKSQILNDDFVFYRHLTTPSLAKSHQMSVITRKSDNHWVYCIQPGTSIFTDELYTGQDSNQDVLANMTKEQWRQVSLIAYYGYGYKGHTDLKWYSVTQLLIWQTVPSEYEIYFSSDLGNHKIEKYTAEIAELKALVANHAKKPSFSDNSYVFSINEKQQFTDTNLVLTNYQINKCENCEAMINNNILSVKATKKGNINVELVKKDSKYSVPPIVYLNDRSQNVMMVGTYDPLSANLKGTVITGTLKLKKYDEDNRSCKAQNFGSLEGAKYDLYKSNGTFIKTLVIDKNCSAAATDLELGSYYIIETSAGLNYELDTRKHYFELTKEEYNYEMTVYDKMYLGQIKIRKFDAGNKSCKAQGKASLIGTVYGIYKEDGTLLQKLVIQEDCSAISSKSLLLGNYYIQEISAYGYQLDTQKHYFSITKANADKEILLTLYDKVFQTELKIHKDFLIEEGVEAEANAVYEVESKTTGKIVATLTTDEFGSASVILPFDDYLIRQIKGKKDYDKTPDFELKVDENSKKETYYSFLNKPYSAKLKVVKIDVETGKPISMKGIKFKIYDKVNNKYVCQNVTYPNVERICVFETNSDGEFITPMDLFPSIYQLEEIEQFIDGYLWNSEPVEFQIGKSTLTEYIQNIGNVFTQKFYNKPVKGRVEITKIGEQLVLENDSYHYEEIKLDGVKYELYAAEDIISGDGTLVYKKDGLVGTYETTDGFLIVSNLNLGKYYFIETSTLNGYVLDTTRHEFELAYKDPYTDIVVMKFVHKNYLEKGVVEFTKTDFVTGQPLPNTKIQIYLNNNDEESYLVFEGITDSDGNIIINDLPFGKYILVESEAPSGYLLNSEPIKFEITKNGEIIKADMTNERVIKVPNTGIHESCLLEYFSLFLIFVGSGVICYSRNKKIRKEEIL